MWETVKLQDLFKIGSSKRVLKSEWKNIGVPFYRGREITTLSKVGSVDNDLFITEEHYSELKSKYGVPQKDDLVVTAIGTIGNTYVVQERDRFYFKDASVLWLKKISDVNSRFVNYWFKSSFFFEQLETGNGATVDTLSISKLNNMVFKLPPLTEQQRIVAKLDAAFAEINDSIAITKKKEKEIEKLKSSLMISILNVDTTTSKTLKLGDYYDVRDGTHDSPKYVDVGFPLVTSKNLKNGKIDLSKIKYISEKDFLDINRRSGVDIGDVLMAMIGTIGNPVEIVEKPNFAIKNVALFKTNAEQSSTYLYYFLIHPRTIEKMMSDAKGTTQKFVGLSYLRNFPIPVPSFAEQKSIVAKLNAIFSELLDMSETINQSLANYQALKSAILVQELQREVA